MRDRKTIEEQTADLYADLFVRTSGDEFYKKAQNYIDRTGLEKDWFAGKTCLDAGCGSGVASYSFSKIDKTKVIAFDIGYECLKIARKNLEPLNNCALVQSSVERVPFKDGAFDFINCNGVLHHIPDINKALSEFFRVLKPQGLLFIGVYGRGGLMNEHKINFYRLFSRLVPYYLLRKLLFVRNKNEWLDNLCVPIRNAFSEQEIRRMLSRSGFSDITRISRDFYRRPCGFLERLIIGRDGMYIHFLAKKGGRN
ncbi:MAG: methyltransferase domain-containing protein [Candidatus Omnitrophota bacterium]|nr:methyltransferase domain-containing protein [Candidatus Omnitrophota bacterium]